MGLKSYLKMVTEELVPQEVGSLYLAGGQDQQRTLRARVARAILEDRNSW